MKDFIEMVSETIKNEGSLTIGRELGEYHDIDSIIPCSITVDSKIHIQTETGGDVSIPKNSEISYNDFEEEYVIKYGDMTMYIF